MGNRKQRTKWCSVDWSQDNQAVTSSEASGNSSDSGTSRSRRSSAKERISPLAPRFEKKAAAVQKHVYYEGEFCEAEDLPNGFIKVKSKNLDVLFKREYYEQKISVKKSVEYRNESTENGAIDKLEVASSNGEETVDKEETITDDCGDINMSDSNTSVQTSFDQINLNDIQEFQPMNSCDSYPDPSCLPYISYYQYPQCQNLEARHSNLFLYSPSENSLIPCEEIIIPNPGMSSDGPVYTGPTNVYLTYPVQGPDGRGYITQSFTPPGSYLSQDSGRYSYVSSPEDSRAISPPPQIKSHETYWEDSEISNIDAHGEQTQRRSTPTPDNSVSHIPGLVYKLDSNQKKTSKKRKKKNKEDLSTQDEVATCSDRADPLHTLSSRDGSADVLSEPVQEVCLTDDLANSLVNPPTDFEMFEDQKIVTETKLDHDIPVAVVDQEYSLKSEEAQDSKSINENELPSNPSKTNSTDIEVEEALKSSSAEVSENNVDEKNNSVFQPLTSALVPMTDFKRKSKNRKRQSFPQVKENLQTDKTHPSTDAPSLASSKSKKSYSSVIKISLEHPETQQPVTSCIESSAGNQTNQSMLDNEKDSASVEATPAYSNSWVRKTAKRKKHKNRITISDENLVTEEEIKLDPVALKGECHGVEVTIDESTDEINNNEVERKKYRKKKKSPREDSDGSSSVHRVIIRDDQVDMCVSQPVRRISPVETTSLLKLLNNSGYDDIILVSELGSGITRGSMNYGRLYLGKYIPPDRTDGVPPSFKEENKDNIGEDKVEIIEDHVPTSAVADIDLD